jgi:hypothetical protein
VQYTVEPEVVEGCDCPDCRAGKHLYALHRWRDGQWQFVGVSLQAYASTDECKRTHWWGIEFHAEDVWEDGTAIVPPENAQRPTSSIGGKVTLDLNALHLSAEALRKHWLK